MSLLTLETKKYSIKIDNFEGPLDLLCYLIDKNKMDIYDVNLSEITEQYIEFLNAMKKLNLEIASEFIVMASTLLYLKSKKLLPNQKEDEEEITEEELIKRIIEYKKYKEISNIFKENYNIYSNRIFKNEEKIELPKRKLDKDYSPEKIPEIYSKLIKRNSEKINQNAKNIEKIAIVDKYTVTEKVQEMSNILENQNSFVFNKIFPINKHEKEEVVTAFSGLLEMSKTDEVKTEQDDVFGDILVEKKTYNF